MSLKAKLKLLKSFPIHCVYNALWVFRCSTMSEWCEPHRYVNGVCVVHGKNCLKLLKWHLRFQLLELKFNFLFVYSVDCYVLIKYRCRSRCVAILQKQGLLKTAFIFLSIFFLLFCAAVFRGLGHEWDNYLLYNPFRVWGCSNTRFN